MNVKKLFNYITTSALFIIIINGCGDNNSTKNSNETYTTNSSNALEKNGTYSGNNVRLRIYGNNWDCELNDGGPTINSSGILIGNSLYIVDENGKTNVGYVNSSGVTLTMGGHVFLKKQSE